MTLKNDLRPCCWVNVLFNIYIPHILQYIHLSFYVCLFRSGLGNSLYSGAHKIGGNGTAQLQQFVAKHFTTGRTALVGVGVNHSDLTKVFEIIKILWMHEFNKKSLMHFWGMLLTSKLPKKKIEKFRWLKGRLQSWCNLRHFFFLSHSSIIVPVRRVIEPGGRAWT